MSKPGYARLLNNKRKSFSPSVSKKQLGYIFLSTLAFPCIDGTYLPKQENEFVHTVLEELDAYQKKGNRKSVLLFPPLSSRLRFLTHKTTENHPELVTFSVGEGWSRRVVVCYSELRGELEEDSDTEVNNSPYEEPSWPRGRGGTHKATKSTSPTPNRIRRAPRKPDQPLYVPRASRERRALQSLPLPREKFSSIPVDDGCNCSCCCSTSASSDSCSCSCSSSDITESTTSTNISNCESLPSTPNSVANCVDDGSSNSSLPCPHDEQQNMCMKQEEVWDMSNMPLSYFVAMTLEDDEKEYMGGLSCSPKTTDTNRQGGVSCSPNTNTTDINRQGGVSCCPNTNTTDTNRQGGVSCCPNPTDANTEVTFSTFQEIIPYLTNVDVCFEHAHNDYSCFENVRINLDDFGHVIEIYDFPGTFSTDDLLDAFAEYSDGGFKIKWVDNTHALGVFSSRSAAIDALSINHPLLKTRTLSKGSKKAKGKAISRAEFIQPVKERPRTDSTVARRMVTRALGLQRGGRTRRF